MSVYVRFEAEIRLYDDDVPETLNYAEIAQAVQSVVGHIGVAVIDVLEYEHDGLPRTDPAGTPGR